VCEFVLISLPRIKLAASNFARWFIGVVGRESHILGNFAPQCTGQLTNSSSGLATRKIGMCGYTATPKMDLLVIFYSVSGTVI